VKNKNGTYFFTDGKGNYDDGDEGYPGHPCFGEDGSG
jgi:hypothetical protein